MQIAICLAFLYTINPLFDRGAQLLADGTDTDEDDADLFAVNWQCEPSVQRQRWRQALPTAHHELFRLLALDVANGLAYLHAV